MHIVIVYGMCVQSLRSKPKTFLFWNDIEIVLMEADFKLLPGGTISLQVVVLIKTSSTHVGSDFT